MNSNKKSRDLQPTAGDINLLDPILFKIGQGKFPNVKNQLDAITALLNTDVVRSRSLGYHSFVESFPCTYQSCCKQ
jgi:hypothetical protein